MNTWAFLCFWNSETLYLFLHQTTFLLFHVMLVCGRTLVSSIAQICVSCDAFIKSIEYIILSPVSCNHKVVTIA